MNMEALSEMWPTFMLRLLVAGLLGFLIGLEREFRAKEAGVRTHFLVALGSALIMIVSQWGFTDIAGKIHVDGSRVAAQIVSGIGFIGAGTIMMHKEFVRGLTTAAALWVASGIGIAIGGGLYRLGIAATLLAIVGMEFLPLLTRKFRSKCSSVVLIANADMDLIPLTEQMSQAGYRVVNFEVEPHKKIPDKIKIRLLIREHDYGDENHLVLFFQQFPGVSLEKVE